MSRKILIGGAVLTLALAALLFTPAWSGANEPTAEQGPDSPAGHGYLGVRLRPLTAELQTHFGAPEGSGVLVASVSDDSPAAAAGVEVGDVITAVDGLTVDSVRDLSREVRHRPGDSVILEVYRDGERRELTALLGERQARSWEHHGRSPEEWTELAEHWQSWGEEFGERMGRWGEEFGERWGEEFGERWGEQFAERWSEEHAESWEQWAEEMAAQGEAWGAMGEAIARAVEEALGEVDWEEIGRSVEESMNSLEDLHLEEIGQRIERQLEEVERRFDESREDSSAGE